MERLATLFFFRRARFVYLFLVKLVLEISGSGRH
jgi:hypothetical protein